MSSTPSTPTPVFMLKMEKKSGTRTFPNIRRLTCRFGRPEKRQELFKLLIGSSLLTMRDTWDQREQPDVDALLHLVAQRAPLLEDLQVENKIADNLDFSPFVNLKRLQVFTLQLQSLLSLAACHDLREILVNWIDGHLPVGGHSIVLPALESLSTKTDNALSRFPFWARMPNLRRLTASEIQNTDEKAFEQLRLYSPSLQDLRADFSDSFILHLLNLGPSPNLKTLTLTYRRGTPPFSDENITRLAEYFPNLTRVHMEVEMRLPHFLTLQATGRSLLALIQHCPSLEYLVIPLNFAKGDASVGQADEVEPATKLSYLKIVEEERELTEGMLGFLRKYCPNVKNIKRYNPAFVSST